MPEDTTNKVLHRKLIITISGCGEPDKYIAFDFSAMTDQRIAEFVECGGLPELPFMEPFRAEMRRRLRIDL